jgi:hypothetical protein
MTTERPGFGMVLGLMLLIVAILWLTGNLRETTMILR